MEAQDLAWEEEVARNPYGLKNWWRYIQHKKATRVFAVDVYVVYERSLKYLPRSYKLWRAYLDDRAENLIHCCITDKRYIILLNTFERALIHMHKMPRIW